MRVTVLGPVAIVVDGRPYSVARAQNRGMLGRLLLDAGRPVSAAAIVEAIWGGAAPPSARAQVHAGMHAIKCRLAELGAPALFRSGTSGYQVDVPPGGVDLLDFEARVRQARRMREAGDPGRAAASLRAALDLWQGEPLAGAEGAFAGHVRAELAERRLGVLEEVTGLELELGRHAAVVAELAAAVAVHPLRETLRARLALALHRCGRTAEALENIRCYRRFLADEIGIDAGPDLMALELAMLRADPVLEPRFRLRPDRWRRRRDAHRGQVRPARRRRGR
jgi:DNA-binding SARP family transcriptional activator